MPLTRLKQASKKSVGTKQTMKAVHRGHAQMVFVARDAERHVIEPIVESCKAKGISVIEVDTMQALGEACGIEVGCASAALLKE